MFNSVAAMSKSVCVCARVCVYNRQCVTVWTGWFYVTVFFLPVFTPEPHSVPSVTEGKYILQPSSIKGSLLWVFLPFQSQWSSSALLHHMESALLSWLSVRAQRGQCGEVFMPAARVCTFSNPHLQSREVFTCSKSLGEAGSVWNRGA